MGPVFTRQHREAGGAIGKAVKLLPRLESSGTRECDGGKAGQDGRCFKKAEPLRSVEKENLCPDGVLAGMQSGFGEAAERDRRGDDTHEPGAAVDTHPGTPGFTAPGDGNGRERFFPAGRERGDAARDGEKEE